MKKLLTMLTVSLGNKKGQGMVEYGLIIALIAVVVIGAVTLLGTNVLGVFNSAASAF